MITGVHLITGLIGSGKTLRTVWWIDQEVRAGRAVYVCNLNGINMPGVIPFEDPRNWRDLPPGSLLVVDEAQRFWRARRSGEVPEELQAMETSRHDAVSFLIVTQQPSYLDKHLRGLVTKHEHLYRRMGLKVVEVFAWERCVEDPMSPVERDGANSSVFPYPKGLFEKYKSAEVHTVKPKMAGRMKLVILALAVGLFLIGRVVWRHSGGEANAAEATAQAQVDARPAPAPAAAGRALPRTRLEYEKQMKPRIEGAYWSAPIYDDVVQPTTPPEVICAIAHEGFDANQVWQEEMCHCLSDQGTRVEMDPRNCRNIVIEGGILNPYKERRYEGAGQRPAAMGEPASRTAGAPAGSEPASPTGIGEVGQATAAYGAFRSESK